MRTLGLDPSLKSYGWSIYDNTLKGCDSLIASGSLGTDPKMVPVCRYTAFRDLINDLFSRFNIDLVGLESPAYGGGEFSERHFSLMMFSSEAIFNARKDLVLFDPSTVKYLSTGNNQAEKIDMRRHFQLLLNTTDASMNSDEIDAFWVARHASRFYELKNSEIKPSDLSKEETRVFLSRIKKKKTKFGLKIKHTSHIFRENNRYFRYSQVPHDSILLPTKDAINEDLISWLEESF